MAADRTCTAAAAATRRERWERIGLGIRLGYNPYKPEVARYWVALGQRLAEDGVLEEACALRRTLDVLLQVAHDEALPWFWRSVCLEQTVRPVARLVTLLRPQDPVQAAALYAATEAARDRIDALPPPPARPAVPHEPVPQEPRAVLRVPSARTPGQPWSPALRARVDHGDPDG